MIENLKRGKLSEQLWVKQHIFWRIILKESVKKVLIKADILTILKMIELQGEKCIKREVGVIYELVIYNISGLYFPKQTKLFSKHTCLHFLNP